LEKRVDIVIEIGRNLVSPKEITLSSGRMKPVYKPSEKELEVCPDEFICFVCLERRPKGSLGNILSGQYVCRHCRPHTDEYGVNLLLKFDERSLMHLGSKPVKKVPDDIIPEDWEKIDLVEMVVRRIQGQETENVWRNAYSREDIDLSPGKREAIDRFRIAFNGWELAHDRGFPGIQCLK
jgi:hypothetical protein